MNYLCYDIKGIQSFIFAVPRLKYIVGGSIIIDRFDGETIPDLQIPGTERLFSGGGKGVFHCDDRPAARRLEEAIVKKAHAVGLGVAIGVSEDYSEAARCADRFFPCLPPPDELEGHPCAESGLYPVPSASNGQRVHQLIARRVFQRGDLVRRRLEDRLLKDLNIPQIKTQSATGQVEFFHDTSDETDEGICALEALGGRKRWAIICMDGNDIGSQFRQFQQCNPSEDEMHQWVRAMSQALDRCSLHAARRGCEEVLRRWASEADRVQDATTRDGVVVLPIRPLVVGGDDLAVLCHSQYAFDFVEEACRAFSEQSVVEEKQRSGLWPATGGRLTLSAGVLFCPIPLPLHMALPYAESLLASAKSKGRKHAASGQPSPACIDYETITETMLDTVSDRRHRELRFVDGDVEDQTVIVELTEKPYLLDDFRALRQEATDLERLPRSIRHDLLARLRSGRSDRAVYRAQIGKRHPKLFDRLDERNWRETVCPQSKCTIRSTPILDQVEILEEMHRASQTEDF